MIYELLGLQVESYGTWLLLQRLDDPSKDSDTPKNVPFAFAINNRNPRDQESGVQAGVELEMWKKLKFQGLDSFI